jgi:hypothetical protein
MTSRARHADRNGPSRRARTRTASVRQVCVLLGLVKKWGCNSARRGPGTRPGSRSGGRWVTAEVRFANTADTDVWVASRHTDTNRDTGVAPASARSSSASTPGCA